MKLALVQFNPTIGALEQNVRDMALWISRAKQTHQDSQSSEPLLVVFPELALCGYPPKDLLLAGGFIEQCTSLAHILGTEHSANITLVFGVPLAKDPQAFAKGTSKRLTNSLLVYQNSKLLTQYNKRLLPTYDVFDEDRYFSPGEIPAVIEVGNVKVGLSICEDLWRGQDVGFSDRYEHAHDPVADLVQAGASIVVNPSASPFRVGMGRTHRSLLIKHATTHKIHIAAVNQVGGNDELIFDGSACLISPQGHVVAAGPSFSESICFADVLPLTQQPVHDQITALDPNEAIFRALTLGIRDYCRKTGFRSAVLGLSGGIDSALVAVLAASALGSANVSAVRLPSRYSSDHSLADAQALAENLHIKLQTIPIESAFQTLQSSLAPAFEGRAADLTEENLQSRIRGLILMALSNKFGSLLLTTGNKSEMAVGYATLYGDMNGGLAVISDLTKMQVYTLSNWINQNPSKLNIPNLINPPIPPSSITKPPSAELRPNQTDQDSLPPYEVLDEIIHMYITQRMSASQIQAALKPASIDPALVQRVVRLISLAEFKRKQAAPGLKVSSVAFGSGRRMPIAGGWTQ